MRRRVRSLLVAVALLGGQTLCLAAPDFMGEVASDDARYTANWVLAGADHHGRPFASQPGHNDKGEHIVWIDYDASLAIHPLRPAPAHERRPERLASPGSDDNRISLGCIVVPVVFYETVIAPTLGRQHGVIYVLPETRPVQAMFGATELVLYSR